MAVLISWEQLLTPTRLPSGDIIRLIVSPQVPLDSNWIEFRLDAAAPVTWEKRIRFINAGRESAFLRTAGALRHAGPSRFSTTEFNQGTLKFELVKAMAFGVLTGVYELNNVGRWKGQSLLFEWLED